MTLFKHKSFYYAFSILILASSAFAVDYDKLMPSSLTSYWSHDPSKGNAQQFPNYQKAVAQGIETLDDILEWHILKNEWQTICGEVGIEDSWDSFCGDSWAVGITGFGEGGQIPSLIVMTEPEDKAKTEQALTKIFEYAASLHETVRTESDQFRGYAIRTIYGPGMIPGLGLSYTFHESVLIASTSKPMLTDLIDTIGIPEEKLESQPLYQQAMAQLPQDHYAVHFQNFDNINNTLDMLLNMGKAFQAMEEDEDLAKAIQIAETVVNFIKGFHYYCSASQYQSDGVNVSTGITKFDPKIRESLLGTLFSKEPVTFDFASYMPRKTGSFQAANVLALNDVWNTAKQVIQLFPDSEEIFNVIKAAEEENGISLEDDLLSWIGDEWCMVKPVMDLNAVVPVNSLAFMIRLKDEAKAKTSLQKIQTVLTEKYKLPIVAEKNIYRDTEISTLRIPIPIIPVAPSWAFKDGVLIIAHHDSLIREMIDVKSGNVRGIDRNRYFNMLKEHISQPANHVSFHDTESEIYTYRESLKRVSSISELGAEFFPEDQQVPFLLMDRGSYFLSCMEIFKASAKALSIQEDHIRSMGYRIMQDLPAVPTIENMNRKKLSLAGKSNIIELAKTLAQNGFEEQALRIFKSLKEFYPDDESIPVDSAKILLRQGETGQAAQVFSETLGQTPSVSVLIHWAKSLTFASNSELLAWVKEQVSTHPEIQSDSALFGLAIHASKDGKPEQSRFFFEELKKTAGSSTLQKVASNELEYIDAASVSNAVKIPLVTVFPTIDGKKDDVTWTDESKHAVFIPDEDSFKLRAARSGAQLYFLLENSAFNTTTGKQVLDFYFCPSRDYTNVKEIQLEVQNSEFGTSISKEVRNRLFDPFGIGIEMEETGNTSTEWPAAAQPSGESGSIIEFSLPLGTIEEMGKPGNNVWLFNLKYDLEPNAGPKQSNWLSNGTSAVEFINIAVKE